MAGRQRILPVRRDYNRWVANQTLEDYALRFTAKSARRWSAPRVAQTAIGAISFLALEAIGGAITLAHGFVNASAAIVVVSIILLVTGLPIARYAARYGVDIDLLTRGAGFGYIGSTVTSLIYASFTFILFAIEASIMSTALELAFGIPLWASYILSALAVIPLVVYGITAISRFQLWTQPFWIILNILPFAFIAWKDPSQFAAWWQFGGLDRGGLPSTFLEEFDLVRFGLASSVILALMPQIGEQVDFLRFLPVRVADGDGFVKPAHRIAVFFAGPGWIVLGAPKLFAGSLLAVVALRWGVPALHAAEPAHMYDVAFRYMLPSRDAALVLTAAFVVVSQLKINVMNAYAGSLAWSNFFSRLTHSHPGRVVWLVFNVAIALLLMELGIYEALERTLGLFAIVAVAWLGAIVADLGINKPLGLSPPGIEFARAHLWDVNPVGVGAMGTATVLALCAATGLMGEIARAFAPFVALATALIVAPLIALATRGRYYLARRPREDWRKLSTIRCSICEHDFEPEDSAFCPAYDGPICSLCCSLDARCGDLCKPQARLGAQARAALTAILPGRLGAALSPRLVEYLAILTLITTAIGLVLLVIHFQSSVGVPEIEVALTRALWSAFFVLLIVAGVVAWFFVLAHESRRVAEEESARQTTALLDEIAAHERTDAALQKAKEAAEAANVAKSRYLVGLSHELRTPLNAVMGYAQVLERDTGLGAARLNSVKVIRRSGEHLSGLIDGLLDISKIEAGRLELARDEIRLGEFLDQLVEMFRFQAEAKGLAFRFTRPTRLPEVVATDEKRLRQVLVNLLSNAIKFTQAGEVVFDVAMRHEVATFTVTDTGCGIPEGEIARVFEPFERGRRARGQPGLGLGLTITKMLATLMGGDVRVDSRDGEGSRFRVRLMLSVVAAPIARPAPPLAIHGYEGPRRTVMVVDDNAVHRDLVREVLAPIGFTVLEAEDGPSCLALAAEIRPDLFLLDISMPGMDGWDLARRLRAEGFATTRIVILSANVGESRPPDTEIALHDDLLAKPLDVARLIDRIRHHLGLEWRHEPPAAVPPPPEPGRDDRPDRAEAADLLQFARIGYVRGVEERLAAIEAAVRADGDEPGPRLAGLARAVADFDMTRLVRELEAIDVDA
ncbi:response regulator [Siculibacillus lacustris]|uniref:histidine kinase n=1 Tax=Siculibacillus lacustris TaxID=1549641 RepID=A0A4Q9VFX7_9HYPH|nr:ATP-binding protein [Siculibacillus lacustris]TBW33006.1 response regulator [Siculibacillus lacustris]